MQKQSGRVFKPVAELPEHVPAKEKLLSLFADYEYPRASGRISVYFITRTGEAINISAQSASAYFMLECQDDAGDWIRALPQAFSFCGLSYHRIVIAPEHFLEVRSY